MLKKLYLLDLFTLFSVHRWSEILKEGCISNRLILICNDLYAGVLLIFIDYWFGQLIWVQVTFKGDTGHFLFGIILHKISIIIWVIFRIRIFQIEYLMDLLIILVRFHCIYVDFFYDSSRIGLLRISGLNPIWLNRLVSWPNYDPSMFWCVWGSK